MWVYRRIDKTVHCWLVGMIWNGFNSILDYFSLVLSCFFVFGITEEAMAEERVGPDVAANLSLEIWTWIFYLIFFFICRFVLVVVHVMASRAFTFSSSSITFLSFFIYFHLKFIRTLFPENCFSVNILCIFFHIFSLTHSLNFVLFFQKKFFSRFFLSFCVVYESEVML